MRILSSCTTGLACSWIFVLLACSAPVAPINVDKDGNAIKGYDPVAYFTLGHSTKGKKEYQFEWNNARWLFVNNEHLALFKENPSKYAPQYGGY